MGGGKSQTATSAVSIPPSVLAQYNSVNAKADAVAATPFQNYSTNPNAFVAPMTATQQSGISNTNAYSQAAQPAIQQGEQTTQAGLTPALQMTEAGSQAANPTAIGASQINQFMSPYLGDVLGSTEALQNQSNQQQQAGQLGNAITSGAFGGDRAGVAAANLEEQQNLANNATISNIANTGFNTALGAAQQQQGVSLSAEQANLARLQAGGAQLSNISNTTGQQEAGLGEQAQTAGLAGAQAQMTAGQAQQQTQQAGLTALYNQFLQQQSYPFQTTQFLANIAEGTGALSGSTTSTTQPAPFFSDERLKEDIEKIGKTYEGQDIIRFKYKGQPDTHIGLSAQDTEKRHPEAVGLAGGYKTVDYKGATDQSALAGARKHRDDGGYLEAQEQGYQSAGLAPPAGLDPYGGGSPADMSKGHGRVPQTQASSHQMLQPTRPVGQQQPSGMQQINQLAQDAKGLKSDYTGLKGLGQSAAGLMAPAQGTMTGAQPQSASDAGSPPPATIPASDPSVSGLGDQGMPAPQQDPSTSGGLWNAISGLFGSGQNQGGFIARRHRDAGGVIPYDDGGSNGLDIPDDGSTPQQLESEQKGMEGQSGGSGGSGSSGGAGSAILSAATTLLPLLLKQGGLAGRKHRDDGGPIAVDDNGNPIPADLPDSPGAITPANADPALLNDMDNTASVPAGLAGLFSRDRVRNWNPGLGPEPVDTTGRVTGYSPSTGLGVKPSTATAPADPYQGGDYVPTVSNPGAEENRASSGPALAPMSAMDRAKMIIEDPGDEPTGLAPPSDAEVRRRQIMGEDHSIASDNGNQPSAVSAPAGTRNDDLSSGAPTPGLGGAAGIPMGALGRGAGPATDASVGLAGARAEAPATPATPAKAPSPKAETKADEAAPAAPSGGLNPAQAASAPTYHYERHGQQSILVPDDPSTPATALAGGKKGATPPSSTPAGTSQPAASSGAQGGLGAGSQPNTPQPENGGEGGMFPGLSKAFKDNQHLLVPALTALGTMASSNSRYLGSAILQGAGAGAQSYENVLSQEAERNAVGANTAATESHTTGQNLANSKNAMWQGTDGQIYVRTADNREMSRPDWYDAGQPPLAGGVDPRWGASGNLPMGPIPAAGQAPGAAPGVTAPVAAAASGQTTVQPGAVTIPGLGPNTSALVANNARALNRNGPINAKNDPDTAFDPEVRKNADEARKNTGDTLAYVKALADNKQWGPAGTDIVTPFITKVNSVASSMGLGDNWLGNTSPQEIAAKQQILNSNNLRHGAAFEELTSLLHATPGTLNSRPAAASLVGTMLTNSQKYKDEDNAIQSAKTYAENSAHVPPGYGQFVGRGFKEAFNNEETNRLQAEKPILTDMAQHEFKNGQTVMSRLIDAHGQVDPQTRAAIMNVYAPKYGEAAVDGVIKRYFYGS